MAPALCPSSLGPLLPPLPVPIFSHLLSAANEFSIPRCPLGNYLRKKKCVVIKDHRGGNQRARSRNIIREGMAVGTNGVFLTDVENSFLVVHIRQMSRAAWSVSVLHTFIQSSNSVSGEWRKVRELEAGGKRVSLSSQTNPGGLLAGATLCPEDL